MITVIDNFLNTYDITNILDKVGCDDLSNYQSFNLYWNPFVSLPTDKGGTLSNGCFIHNFYRNNETTSEYAWIADIIVDAYLKLDKEIVNECTSLHHAKFNLFTGTEKRISYGFHQDIVHGYIHNSLIFYLDDSDGYTLFDDGSRIRSKTNRACIITGGHNYKHASTNSTQGIRRNINIVMKEYRENRSNNL